jgi:hypothetical protein
MRLKQPIQKMMNIITVVQTLEYNKLIFWQIVKEWKLHKGEIL